MFPLQEHYMVYMYWPKTASLWAFFFEFSIKINFPPNLSRLPAHYPAPLPPLPAPSTPNSAPSTPDSAPSTPDSGLLIPPPVHPLSTGNGQPWSIVRSCLQRVKSDANFDQYHVFHYQMILFDICKIIMYTQHRKESIHQMFC